MYLLDEASRKQFCDFLSQLLIRLDAASVAGSTNLGGFILKFIARVISDGRVTIPEEIRKLLGIMSGDYVSCEIESINSPAASLPHNPDSKLRHGTQSIETEST